MHKEETLLERVLQVHGKFRRSLEPLRVTPLQAGVMLFLRRRAEATMTEAAAALRVSPPTMSAVVTDLMRKRWVTKRRSVVDRRASYLRLSPRGLVLTGKIERPIQRVSAGGAASKVWTAADL